MYKIAFSLLLFIAFISGLFLTSNSLSVNAAKSVKPAKNTPTPTIVLPTPTFTPRNEVIKGINYNPIAIGQQHLDSSAPLFDVAKISQLGANTIGTYNVGQFEWGSTSDISINQPFYDSLSNLADTLGLKLILGYFANNTIDWTDSAKITKVTNQYQSLVIQTKNRPSTYMYLIGNELIERLPNEQSRIAYAKWVGEMVNWTHNQNSNLKITYADNHALTALPFLYTYAPNLDVYSINSYEWSNASELERIIDRFSTAWPNKSVLLHEWGSDSYDYTHNREDQTLQSNRLSYLAGEINKVLLTRPQLLGSIYFEYTDQWDKAGQIDTQDSAAASWRCITCIDSIANEDYWGLSQNVLPNHSQFRILKPSFSSLQNIWKQ